MENVKQKMGDWWPYVFFVVFVLLCVAFLVGHPLFDRMVTLAALFVAMTYAVATYGISRATRRQADAGMAMANEMNETRRLHTSPWIVAHFDNPVSSLIELVVKNTGHGAATEVRLRLEPSLLEHKGRDISELSLFKHAIPYFPPGAEYRQTVGVSGTFFNPPSGRPLEYELALSYSDSSGHPVPSHTIPLDLSIYRNLPIRRKSDIDNLAGQVEELTKQLSQVFGHKGR
ncbi:MAG: hypothetical protein ACOC58_01785 [Chloroflexota bacterium]